MQQLLDVMRGRNIVVYDLEIEHEIDGVVRTWDTKETLGISVGCLFDYRDGDYKVYLKDAFQDLANRLNEADLIVAFNQIQFDNELLRKSGFPLRPDAELFNYDMLVESRAAIGGDKYLKGLKLDDHLKANFGPKSMKTGHGALAPIMWQKGQISDTINYCLADVKRERMLFERAWFRSEYHAGIHGLVKVRDPRTAMRPGSFESFQAMMLGGEKK